MRHFLDAFLAASAAHPRLALAIVMFAAFAESLAIVGTVVPAAVIMFGAGALIGQGTLGMGGTLAWAAAGAIAGDALSYELGRRHQDKVRAWPLFRRHVHHVARAEGFVQRHGVASVALARFTGAVRAFVPLLAGFAHMQRARFYLANVLSALLWAPAHILPGVVFGTSLQLAEAASGRLALLLLLLVLLLWGAVWVVTRGIRWLVPLSGRMRQRALGFASGRNTRLARAARVLLDPERPGSEALLASLLLLLGSMWLFLALVEDVLARDPLVLADRAVFTFLQQLRTDLTDQLMVGVTELGSVGVMLPLILVIFLWLLWRRCWRTAGYWLATTSSAELLVQVLKRTLGRDRPLALYEGVESFSFPSGHATMTAVVLGFLAFLLSRGQSARWRIGVAAFCAAYVTLVAFSRLYLGAHWLSDVLGGISFGLAWVALAALVYLQHQIHEPLAARSMGALALAVLALSGTLWASWQGTADRQRYAAVSQPRTMAFQAWATGGWRALPPRRREIAGEPNEEFPLQWACDEGELRRHLAQAGWTPAPRLSLTTMLLALTPQPQLQQLPVLPRFDEGRRSLLVLARAAAGGAAGRQVLRLWRSEVAITAQGRTVPLWYGAIYLQQPGGPRAGWVRESAGDIQPMAAEAIRQGLWTAGPRPVLVSCSPPP
jgi:membrane protein DedA with SNARE-associated domain/membrane-associated phospholipid phosphatase